VNKEKQTRKRRQKQAARTGPAAKKAKTGKIPLVEEEVEPIKKLDVSGSPMIAELDKEVDELLARPFISEAVDEGGGEDRGQKGQRDEEVMVQMGEEDEEEEEERDEDSSASERRRRRSLFAPKRLSVPPGHMIKKCMEVMMGGVNRATIRSLRELPLKHKCAILCKNMAETSLITRDVLRTAVQTDDRRCRKVDRLMEEKYALEQEVKELKFEYDFTFEISSQMKAGIEMAMGENQTLEKKNEELENKNEEMKSALEGEKNKRGMMKSVEEF
ncbi:hypothetical protein Dimus_026509, partial [Dionaea muscipula]